MNRKIFSSVRLLTAAIVLVLCGFFVAQTALAQSVGVSVTPAYKSGTSAGTPITISAGMTGSSTGSLLVGPIITETATGDIGTGSITLRIAPGFEFLTSYGTNPVPNVLVTKLSGDNDTDNINGLTSGSTIAVTITSSTAIIDITQSTAGNNVNSIKWQNLRIRPVAGSPLAVNQDMVLDDGGAGIQGIVFGSGGTSMGNITEIPGSVSMSKSTISADPTSLTAGDLSGSTILVIAYDNYYNPVPDKLVSLATSGSNNVISPDTAVTDSSGRAVFTFSSTKAEQKTINASIDGNTINDSATVTFVAGEPAKADFSASTTDNISATTFVVGQRAKISVAITDANDNPVADGTTFEMTSTLGVLSGCSPATASGNATCFLDSTEAGTAEFAITGIAPANTTGDTSVVYNPGDTYEIFITASPESLAFDQTSEITITAKDAFGNDATTDNTTKVALSADGGGSLAANILTLSGGTASTALSKTSTGVVHITASSGTLSPVSTTVTFTQTDTSAPYVESTSPANGDTSVQVSATLVLTFSEALDATTVSSSNIQLRKYSDDSAVDALVYQGEGNRKVKIDPSSSLDYKTQYYFWVSSDVKDSAGNALSPVLDEKTKDSYAFTTIDDPTVLCVTKAALVKNDSGNFSATADGDYANGWRWLFEITLPTTETSFSMSFNDWSNTNGVNSIAVADNMKFYSAQAQTSKSKDAATTVSAASAYATDIILDSDADPATAGRQIKVYVDVKVPVGSAAGSYYTQYSIRSSVPAS